MTMLSHLGEEARRQVILEANELIAAQEFFEAAKDGLAQSRSRMMPLEPHASRTCEMLCSSGLSLRYQAGPGIDAARLLHGREKAIQDHQEVRSCLRPHNGSGRSHEELWQKPLRDNSHPRNYLRH